ncbi:peroxiredoxin Q/BCP [Psychromicrobium silvestre]|uniref:thioredoxin-dependent peroxiredoxin n=1 Tax=Psychromicrobium silvestre TaxID=1645614 RepID=A0A7Y9S5T5_9MICC|nr:peroxiredoxin [Psychromicrobium silvestre]NYE94221.1 peroxiredoxin Q/BCP [Psychromicrobium silvestre]
MRKGDLAEDFELPDQNGKPLRLSAVLAEGPAVLFFYPLAMSGGCTLELQHFRDRQHEFTELGARLVGVSRDSVERQAKFATENQVSFPLLSDAEGLVVEAYGVKRRLLAKTLPVKRSTFVINSERRIVEVISSETDMKTHADSALAALTTRQL